MKGRIADFLLFFSEIVLYTSVYCSYCMFGKLSVYSDHVCSSDGQTGVFSGKAIRQILSGTAGAVLFSVLILLPSVFMGTPQTLMNI